MTRNNESNPGKIINFATTKLVRDLKESGYTISGKPILGVSQLDTPVVPIKKKRKRDYKYGPERKDIIYELVDRFPREKKHEDKNNNS